MKDLIVEDTKQPSLEYLFNPGSIAIAGASNHAEGFSAGRIYMQVLADCGFKGKMYPVNPEGEAVNGWKGYRNIKDIPGPVDYAISAIPARYTPQFIRDCADKGVRTVHLFTAGFREIEDQEGRRLEATIAGTAAQKRTRLIGPNCMGLYCPSSGLSFALNFPKKSGPFGFMAQSGGNSTFCVWEATSRGVHFSKAISYGNAVDLNETDFLAYLTADSSTKIIGAYIEGVKEGPRFLRVLRQAARKKPVIIYKAGVTETGSRAAASHTGAVAGSERIWKGLIKQSGVIAVQSIEEIVDAVLPFLHWSLPGGKRVAIIGMGGGNSVKAADDCARAGLVVPMLTAEVKQKLGDLFSGEAGWSFRNPVDIVPMTGPEMLVEAVQAISDCDRIDMLLIQVGFDIWPLIDQKLATETYIEGILRVLGLVRKPLAVVLHSHSTEKSRELAARAHDTLRRSGIPVYPSPTRAAGAISKYLAYHGWLRGAQGKGINSDPTGILEGKCHASCKQRRSRL